MHETINDVSETEDEGFSVQGIMQPFSFTDCSYYPTVKFTVIDSSGGCSIEPSFYNCNTDTLFIISNKYGNIDSQSEHGTKAISALLYTAFSTGGSEREF